MSVRRFLLAVPALAAVLTFAAVGCDKTVDGEKNVIISGTVIDSVSRAPIDSAWVSFSATPDGLVDYTDSLGAFSIPSFTFQTRRLYAGKSGFVTGSTVVQDGNGDVSGIVIKLMRSGL